MASSAAHKAKVRRAERGVLTAHGSINLVPLVDILTSIVFFSLLTYTGEAMARLTAYDLSLPPTVVTPDAGKASNSKPELNLLLAVRVENNRLQVEHTGGVQNGSLGFRQVINGIQGASLDSLESLMVSIRQQYPQNNDVLVVPSDEISYDDVIHVLERLRRAQFANISLGSRARSTQIASAGDVR